MGRPLSSRRRRRERVRCTDMRISIDGERCSGHGRCYDVAADLFDADDEGRGVVRMNDVPAHLEDVVRLAVGSCPEGAIAIEA